MKRNFFSKPSLIGLDIQPETVWLVQLKKHKNELLLEQAIKLSVNQFELEKKSHYWQEVQIQLTEMINKEHLRATAAVGLPAHLITMHEISLPANLPKPKIEAEIYHYLRQELGIVKENLYLDYIQRPDKEMGDSKIFFAAARQEHLNPYVTCVKNAGLTVKIVDVNIYALVRAIFYVAPREELGELCAIVHWINNQLLLIIMCWDEIIFHDYWNGSSDIELIKQLEFKLQYFFTTFPYNSLQSCILACSHSRAELLQRENIFINAKLFFYLDYMDKIIFSSTANQIIFQQYKIEFLIAVGLAMRDVPVW